MSSGCVNKAIIVGRIGRDAEIRTLPNGTSIANITIATSEEWTDKNTREKQNRTEWHRVVLYRRLAEIAGQYLQKGALVYVEGRIQTRSWDDKEGAKHTTTEIIADRLQMLGGSSGGSRTGQNSAEAPAHQQNSDASTSQYPSSAADDDIPF